MIAYDGSLCLNYFLSAFNVFRVCEHTVRNRALCRNSNELLMVISALWFVLTQLGCFLTSRWALNHGYFREYTWEVSMDADIRYLIASENHLPPMNGWVWWECVCEMVFIILSDASGTVCTCSMLRPIIYCVIH